MNLGYKNPLYILAFDHRSSLIKKLFNFTEPVGEEQEAKIKAVKEIIFQGALAGIKLGVPKEQAAILVDEQFGSKVLEQAKAAGLLAIQTTEKSGQEEFDFEYEDFGEHLKKYGAGFAKALVRYNPEGDQVTNGHNREKLKVLSDFCHKQGLKFLIEPLIAPTAEELVELANDKEQYDVRMRPQLTVRMIKELQEAGVEPDIWKIEGLESPADYEKVVAQARTNNRTEVSVVVLGRGESKGKVEDWLKAGKGVAGVTGFAIGRTIFWEPLEKFNRQESSAQEAAEEIGRNYFYFYQVFAK